LEIENNPQFTSSMEITKIVCYASTSVEENDISLIFFDMVPWILPSITN
jgi:hypothetical protein